MDDQGKKASESVMVIGGGIAGIEAALNLADYGLHVYLVEDTPSIGGLMARLDKTFPTNDCSICIEAPKMYEIQKHPNIKLLTNCEVRRVKGEAGNFTVRINRKPRFVDEEKCKGCGKCSEVCPVSIPDELDGKITGERKLVHIPFPQAVPNSYLVDNACRYGDMREKGACIGECLVDCIQCRECQIAKCVVACKEEGADAVLLWQQAKPLDIQVRSIIVASGNESFDPPEGLYGYGKYENVITNLQFERLMNAGGPTEGDIIKPSDGEHPKKIAWVQCVGREKRVGVPYCSKVCCMISTKQTIITKEHHSEVDCIVFNNHMKDYGKGFHEFYTKAKEHGVRYVLGKPSDVYEDQQTKKLSIRYEDMVEGKVKDLDIDILVLSTGLSASPRNKKLAKVLKIELDENGFFKESDPVNEPLRTNVDGIFLCGGATGPIDISESVVQAEAASLLASSPRWSDGE
jgi:heterodisulfide reductase subunit A